MGRGSDEKFESEFQHPQQARSMPYAPEAVAERNQAAYCQPCKEQGRMQMAHRVLPGRRGICNWCYRGEKHPGELKKPAVMGVSPVAAVVAAVAAKLRDSGELREATSHISTTNEEAKEEVMANCKCGRPQSHRGRCWVRRGLKAAPEKKASRGGGGGNPARQEASA